MIERLLVAYLTPLLPGIWVGARVPNPRPDQFVRLWAVGGVRQNLRQDRPMVTIQAWAIKDADLFMAEVREFIYKLPGQRIAVPAREGAELVQAYSVTEAGGPNNYPDLDTGMPRYQMTVEIRISH